MIYKEEVRDLFSVPDDYYFVQCISGDFAMGKGIAVEFNKRFDTKNQLQHNYSSLVRRNEWGRIKSMACLLEGRVFNLVTKIRYYEKPTYQSMTDSLKRMRVICDGLGEARNIHKIAMSTIGCGLDRLQWDKVSEIIKEVFKDSNLEILVCKKV